VRNSIIVVFVSLNREYIDYLKAKGLADEAVALAQSILDARLTITRLRQAHPSPRLTIPVAEEQLSSQVVDMQMLEDESQRVNEKIARVKGAIKEGTVEIDRLRSEKAELEKKVATHKVEADDGRAVDLCDWCVSCATLLSAIGLETTHPGIHRL
jgi:anti-sigma28 factor (negative regulator of flagellin synthesis)